ncbi:orotate phosphoribosyltransferase [Pradoshia sp. D12]|uniref:orotate phosphoribosyltransferase n=1 Tax=Bacillaceae TaxID=186817 RepID=UPI0011286F1D|nr:MULTISPECIES: orotate phosphoribosyltransferase [Bacillaceae]QFK70920.1 orotate phosphoribosyltransferase [Pradoshia sp. D12]TPF72712.1 orotate phosphoribosyltransferase [Bacillus sp. D12]
MKRKIAERLLSIQAVALQPSHPFTWSSGIKSPIYCDNRLTMSYPEVRKDIAKGLAQLIKEKFPEAEIIAGTATAGIPHAAWVSEQLDFPMIYVRSSAKGHGKGNQIEGKAEKSDKVVIVEDLISTGGSSITCAKALREAGCDVLGVVSIFTYEMDKATSAFADIEIPYYSLSDYSTLIEVAEEHQYVTKEELNKLRKWKQNPYDESWVN